MIWRLAVNGFAKTVNSEIDMCGNIGGCIDGIQEIHRRDQMSFCGHQYF